MPGLQQRSKMFHYRADRNIAYFASRAQNDFYSSFGNLLADVDSKGDTNQICVLELHSRPFVAVINNHIESGIRSERRTISTVPSVTFLPTLTLKGIPIKSASLNFTPGRSSRSSIITSNPASDRSAERFLQFLR